MPWPGAAPDAMRMLRRALAKAACEPGCVRSVVSAYRQLAILERDAEALVVLTEAGVSPRRTDLGGRDVALDLSALLTFTGRYDAV